VQTVFRISVRSTDLDAQRHVNNAVYFQYFEQARLEHLKDLGFLPMYAPGETPRHSIAIAETTCRYKAPAYYGDTLLVKVSTREVRQRSFALAYEVRREGDGALVAEGESVQVWLNEGGRAAALPEPVRRSLEGSLGH
jgi:acyl-CoA thioester hydrolase